MLICDCGSWRAGPLRRHCHCAEKDLPPAGAARGPGRLLWSARASDSPHVVASGKTCPKCGEITYLSRMVCGGCAHAYRTVFPSGLASAAGAAVSPDRPAPEAPASRAGVIFLLAAVLMAALAAGLIFYFVNCC